MGNEDVELYRAFQQSPLLFIEKMWGLIPQPQNEPFIRGKHLTWQQSEIIRAVEKAIRGEAVKRISIRSGHGIGKTAALAMLILWYLFCFKDAQVPCTAPTSDQIHDVLWKELANWLYKMPKPIADLYEWQSGYLRIRERPETWFARAKTARKEAPEALAGIHSDFVLMIVDEASGVPEEIFNTAQGALTNTNILVILISNPTRLIGYFYDSHHKDKANWQTLGFSSQDSPIVDHDYVLRIIEKHGRDSDEYRIRVLGDFPKADALDDKGYVPLLVEADLHTTPLAVFQGWKRMGIDPAGEGDDETIWVVRDNFKAKVVGREKTSTTKTIAQKTLTLMQEYEPTPGETYNDNFGEGANVGQELAVTTGGRVSIVPVNVGDQPMDDVRFMNLRAEAYWRMREWLRKGGELVADKGWEELLTIRYRAELNGKLRIMSKKDMRSEGYRSPNVADALMLTFVTIDPEPYTVETQEQMTDEDRYRAVGLI